MIKFLKYLLVFALINISLANIHFYGFSQGLGDCN